MNRVIRWNDIERESLPRLFSQVRVHSEKKTSTREQYPSYTRAVPLAHACSTPRTRVHYPSYTGVLPLAHWSTTPRTRVFEDRECDVALNLYRKWFDKYTWLHYDDGTDSAYCFTCKTAHEQNKLSLAMKT